MFKKILKYISFFFLQALIFYTIIDFIILPVIANNKKELYLEDVRGLDIKEAVNQLDLFEIDIYNEKFTKGMIPGRVIDMSPKPFSYIKEGKVIKLSVVSNPENYIVENYINKSFRDINLLLDRKSVSIDTLIYEFSNNIKKGHIIDQYPKALDTLNHDQKITLIISQGNHPNYYLVPNLINLSLDKANKRISKSGLILGKIKYEYNENYLNNTVLEQSHPANKRLSFPGEIDLILSTDKRSKNWKE